MNRTRIIFFVIIGLAIAIVIGGVLWTQLGKDSEGPDEPVAEDETLEVNVVAALPVADWVQDAARKFN